jgi:hypothetical protein
VCVAFVWDSILTFRLQQDLDRRKRDLNDAIAAAEALTTENGYAVGLAAGGSGRLMHPHKHKHSPFLEELQLESPMNSQPTDADLLRRRKNSKLKDSGPSVLHSSSDDNSSSLSMSRDRVDSSGMNTSASTLDRSQGASAVNRTGLGDSGGGGGGSSNNRPRSPSLRSSMTLQALLSPRNEESNSSSGGGGNNFNNLANSGSGANSRPPSWMSNCQSNPSSPRGQSSNLPNNLSNSNSNNNANEFVVASPIPSLNFKNRGSADEGGGGGHSRDNSRDLSPLVRAGRSPSLRASMTAKALVSPRANDLTQTRDSRDRDGNSVISNSSNSPRARSPSALELMQRDKQTTDQQIASATTGANDKTGQNDFGNNTSTDSNKSTLGKSGGGNSKMRAPTWLLQFNQDMIEDENGGGAKGTPTIVTKGPDPLLAKTQSTPTLQKTPSGNQVHPPSTTSKTASTQLSLSTGSPGSNTNSSSNAPLSTTQPISIGTRKDSHNKTLPTGKPMSVKVSLALSLG